MLPSRIAKHGGKVGGDVLAHPQQRRKAILSSGKCYDYFHLPKCFIQLQIVIVGLAHCRCNRLPLFRQPFSDRYVPGERYRNVHLVRFVEKGRSFADTYQLVGWRSIRLGWEYSYYPFFHIHFRIIFAAFGDRSIFNNPHVGIVYSSTYLYQPQRDHFLQYGTKSGEGLGKPRFQHKSVAYDQSVGGHPVCSPAGALYLADVAPYLGVQRVGWFPLLPA